MDKLTDVYNRFDEELHGKELLQNAFSELCNYNTVETSIYWLDLYLKNNPTDLKIRHIYNLLVVAQNNIDEAFKSLDDSSR